MTVCFAFGICEYEDRQMPITVEGFGNPGQLKNVK